VIEKDYSKLFTFQKKRTDPTTAVEGLSHTAGRELEGRGDLDSCREGCPIYSVFPEVQLPQSHHNSTLAFFSYGGQITIAYSISGFSIAMID